MNDAYHSYPTVNFLSEARGRSLRSLFPLSVWLLLPMLFFATHGSIPILNGASTSELGGTAISGTTAAIGMVVVGASMLMCVWVMLPVYQQVILGFLKETPIAFLTLWALASALWSQAPDDTIRKWAWLMVGTGVAVYLIKCISPQQMFRMLMLVGIVAAVSSILLCVGLPSYGIEQGGPNAGDWQGIFPQKNACGMALVFLITPAFLPSEVTGVRKQLRWAYGLILLFMIIMTKSRTSLGVIALYLALMGALRVIGKFPRIQIFLLVALGLAILGGMAAVVFSNLDAFTELMGRDATFTGRTQIWEAAMRSIAKRPWLGYGYNAFWRGLSGESANLLLSVKFFIIHAHNGFINLWLDLGLVGVVGSIWIFLRAGMHTLMAFHAKRSPMVDWYIGIIFLTLLYNIDESFLLRTLDIEWVLCLAACIGLSEAARATVAHVKEAQRRTELIYAPK